MKNKKISAKLTKCIIKTRANTYSVEWDFFVSFPNSSVVYFYVLDIERDKDEIVSFLRDKYRSYACHYLFTQKPEVKKASYINYADLAQFSATVTDEQVERFMRVHARYNKKSEMISGG